MKGRNSEDFSSLKIGVVQIHSFFRNKFPIIECSVLSFIFFTKKELIKSLCSQGSLSQDFIFLMAFKEKITIPVIKDLIILSESHNYIQSNFSENI